MNNSPPTIDVALVQKLIAAQFPKWDQFPIPTTQTGEETNEEEKEKFSRGFFEKMWPNPNEVVAYTDLAESKSLPPQESQFIRM
jgi:hypothetical protein